MKMLESLKSRFIMWIWNHTPNCADMSRLASRSLEQSLPLSTRIKMRLHFLICIWCKRYFKHLSFLHSAAPQFEENAGVLPSGGLSAEARQRILQRLQVAEGERP